MSQKSPNKSKRLAKADLNFVSQQSFEQVTEQLQNLSNQDIKAFITPVDEDTAVFQLRYQRGDNTTAEVSGRFKRWAGNMTHIYCDGRIFRQRNIQEKLRKRAFDIIIFLGMWAFILTSVLSSEASLDLAMVFWASLFTLPFVLILYGVFNFVRIVVKIIGEWISPQHIQFRDYYKSKPEAKDRERLFHAITSIIRDTEIAQNNLSLEEANVSKALTEAEEALLIAQITLEASKQGL